MYAQINFFVIAMPIIYKKKVLSSRKSSTLPITHSHQYQPPITSSHPTESYDYIECKNRTTSDPVYVRPNSPVLNSEGRPLTISIDGKLYAIANKDTRDESNAYEHIIQDLN